MIISLSTQAAVLCLTLAGSFAASAASASSQIQQFQNDLSATGWMQVCHEVSAESLYERYKNASADSSDHLLAGYHYGGCLIELGLEVSAIKFLEAFLKKHAVRFSSSARATILGTISVAYMRIGANAEAKRALEQSLSIEFRAENASRLAVLYQALLAQSDYREVEKASIGATMRSLIDTAISDASAGSREKGRFLLQLALIEFQLGKLDLARSKALQSIDILKTMDRPDATTIAVLMDAYANLAIIENSLGNANAAKKYAETALSIAPSHRLRIIAEAMTAPVLENEFRPSLPEGTLIKLEPHQSYIP